MFAAKFIDVVINCDRLVTWDICTISGVTGSHLPGVVEEFMKDIGKGGDGERETVRDIYLFTGRAHWKAGLQRAHAKFGLC